MVVMVIEQRRAIGNAIGEIEDNYMGHCSRLCGA
uniref:Uncharacterized protein n=1 Tax=Heterorhabditis bacteriophora TaxID=37862 RepID=A0A1I7XBM6_HETBA